MKFNKIGLALALGIALFGAGKAKAQTTAVNFTFAGQSNQYLVNYCLTVTQVDGMSFPYGAGHWCPNQDTQNTYPRFDDGSLYLTDGDNSPLKLESIEIVKGAREQVTYYPNGYKNTYGAVENFQRTDTFTGAMDSEGNTWSGTVTTFYHNNIQYCGGGRGGNVHRCDYITTIGGTGTITK
jgi:hypothetical protein